MSQSTDESTLRSLRQEHRELAVALAVKTGGTISPLPSSNKADSMVFLRKAIKGMKAQLATKRTKKQAPKPSHSTRQGKFTKKQALQYVDSFEQNYDAQTVKNIEKLRKSKSKRSKKTVKKYDEKKKLYDWLRTEFGI